MIPNRINEDQRFRRQKPIGVGGDGPPIEVDVMVLHPLLLTKNRIETLCVEVAIINLVPT